ncbi:MULTISPECIES: DUF2934 domain-containing protein [Gammaproteobacteria]|uniref:DUF2934 domain-containing protein n=1 Tax=Pseudomonas lini TaxID=163011 RepID=A0A423I9D9_9PSED|nr:MULTISPECIES: DUF2934 domain-containing protein [Gammaproteobacteria]MBK5301168.1 DUF2934 domain-containing protein [Bacillus sp. TH86]MBK5320937.1 DUF2934 domain-containing protein [Bacillus sp. TH59]MBK5335887.1 DUF2934 domain-containing protein [Bacillus sp. TH57]MBK5309964.1 DUF2934 domain-containing protein [Pseudomonas sp. TH71]MBK5315436.1 DUF2934 domain-containing protein [Erwinia sp. TH79]
MSTDDKRIREFAYQIWESEGKPVGQEKRHWEMACKLAEAEALAPGKSSKATGSKRVGTKSTVGKPDGKLNAKGVEPKTKAKAKPSASTVTPLGEKNVEKKPRAARKPPTT